MKIIVAGGTGFIGKTLVKRLLDQNHQVVVLSRRTDAFKNEASDSLRVDWWDGKNLGPWVSHLDGADGVINLCGEGIAEKRWTHAQKQVLRSSRLDSVKVLVLAMDQVSKKPGVLVNASAVGYYGPVETAEVPESFPQGKGFLAQLCGEWEDQAKKAQALGVRVVLVRIGIVLEKEGGALKKMIPPFLFYAGGSLGSGKQYFPWVHREDVVGIILFAVQNAAVSGALNAVSPGVLTMREFCSVLAKVLNRPCWAPVPAIVLKVLLGQMSEMLLTGQKAVPARLLEMGYRFGFTNAESALCQILKP